MQVSKKRFNKAYLDIIETLLRAPSSSYRGVTRESDSLLWYLNDGGWRETLIIPYTVKKLLKVYNKEPERAPLDACSESNLISWAALAFLEVYNDELCTP